MEHGCDIGIATDGDADRLGIIDDKGQFVHPNQILVILYYYLLKYKGWHGPAVRNIATTHLLDKVAQRLRRDSATRCPWASSTFPPRCWRPTPSSAANPPAG